MARDNGTTKQQYTVYLKEHMADILDWFIKEFPDERGPSDVFTSCLESCIHRYVLEHRPDLAKKTSIVKKQAFFHELCRAIKEDAKV